MLCGFTIKLTIEKKRLLLSRQEQESLFHWLWKTTQDHSFVFNTTQGLYLFIAKDHCTATMEKQLDNFLKERISEDYILYNCSSEPNYFLDEVGGVLQDGNTSTFAWKNFISSFLAQLNPFVGDSTAVASLFKNFVGIVKLMGNKKQLDYLKRKMNLLRERVDLGDLSEV
jgi:hypothetical protein